MIGLMRSQGRFRCRKGVFRDPMHAAKLRQGYTFQDNRGQGDGQNQKGLDMHNIYRNAEFRTPKVEFSYKEGMLWNG